MPPWGAARRTRLPGAHLDGARHCRYGYLANYRVDPREAISTSAIRDQFEAAHSDEQSPAGVVSSMFLPMRQQVLESFP